MQASLTKRGPKVFYVLLRYNLGYLFEWKEPIVECIVSSKLIYWLGMFAGKWWMCEHL